jgi:hypothetical protein
MAAAGANEEIGAHRSPRTILAAASPTGFQLSTMSRAVG